MENKKELAQWLLNHSKELDLQVKKLSWIKEWYPELSDIEVSIKVNDKVIIGRGIANTPDLAFTKAGAEAIERAVCIENEMNSCGIAVHTDEELARDNAKNELIERDRFFCHYLTQTPFYDLDLSDHDLNIINKLNELGITLKIYEMSQLNEVKSAIAVSESHHTGFNIGLGASSNQTEAKEKALLECLINTIATHDNKPSRANRDNILRAPEDHRHLYYENSDIRRESSWILKASVKENTKFNIDESLFNFTHLASNNHLLMSSPLIFIKCSSLALQSSFFGETKKEYLNMQQLSNFSFDELSVSDINFNPHPLA